MKILSLLALVAVPVAAQIRVEVQLPTIVFPAPPPLVVVAPGVQVVPDYDDEVFVVDQVYWHRRGPNWYRTSVHTGGWVLVEPSRVPRAIVGFEPGRFRRWKAEKRERQEERREERREEKREEKREGKHKGNKHH